MFTFDLKQIPVFSRIKVSLDIAFSFFARNKQASESERFFSVFLGALNHLQVPQENIMKIVSIFKKLSPEDVKTLSVLLIGPTLETLPNDVKRKKITSKPYLIQKDGGLPYGGNKRDVELLRKAALNGTIGIFADDTQSELIICGHQEEHKKYKVRKGETITWKVLLALLERPGGFWSYRELFEEITRTPWQEIHDSRIAYQ